MLEQHFSGLIVTEIKIFALFRTYPLTFQFNCNTCIVILQERRRELTEQLAASRENEQSVDAWLDMVQDYYNLEELDRPTLVRLIQKIEVGEKRMVDGHEERDFNIYYNFIGHIDL